MKFCDNILLYTLVPLTLLSMGASYVRFMVTHDYLVAYEGECDPTTHSCFIGCSDDECTEEYYYANVQKYAVDLQETCGVDITECDDANQCLSSDRNCSVTYCEPTEDTECKTIEGIPEQANSVVDTNNEEGDLSNSNI